MGNRKLPDKTVVNVLAIAHCTVEPVEQRRIEHARRKTCCGLGGEIDSSPVGRLDPLAVTHKKWRTFYRLHPVAACLLVVHRPFRVATGECSQNAWLRCNLLVEKCFECRTDFRYSMTFAAKTVLL